ncbi:MAG: DUF6259 domain-containing protein [Candidatus Hydrogenedentales bacterium]
MKRIAWLSTPLLIIIVCAAALSSAEDQDALHQTKLYRAQAGCLEMSIEQEDGGIRLVSLIDLEDGTELLAAKGAALFELEIYDNEDKKLRVNSEEGWAETTVKVSESGFVLTWKDHVATGLMPFQVLVKALPDHDAKAWEWILETTGPIERIRLEDVVFPQITLNSTAADGGVLYPDGPGALLENLWSENRQKWQRYGGGWASMQFMAAFSSADQKRLFPGFYYAMHDPLGSTKEIVMKTDAAAHTVTLFFEHPIPTEVPATNDFTLPGKAVWGLLEGDWFDAAQRYKGWVKKEARWQPSPEQEGRSDTPLWMRELCVWAQMSGDPDQVVSKVKDFAAFLDIPIGFHWYNWHQIPFDNDYPHYFPAKEGFAEAVQDLQASNVFVMPYINGRLWDTRDRGNEDATFTDIALPAAAKDRDGSPITETYRSEESDGSAVKLAVMCPFTSLWQEKVKEIVLKLQRDYGVKGVYIDQVAAATPVLCMDPTHKHPLAGGAWWNQGYWDLFDDLRAKMDPDCMITTECNGEPFVNRFDGYLTWHWQTDGQLPVFPAVYGGAIQIFGRSFGGGDTANLALRMRLGQQLVFGEQLGWLPPAVAMAPENGAFFKQLAQLRWVLRRYFYAGEMLRPPKLQEGVPWIKADWQWNGEAWVTTSAILTGAWTLPTEGKTVLLFVNVSDTPLTAYLEQSPDASVDTITALYDKNTAPEEIPIEGKRFPRLFLAPQSAVAWEYTRGQESQP